MNKEIVKPGTVSELIQQASSFLEKIGENSQEAHWLIQDISGWSLTELTLNLPQPVSSEILSRMNDALHLKAEGMPYHYIAGQIEFLEQHFYLNRDVLIPRPETEEWVLKAISQINGTQSLNVIDLGTGSGVIGLSHLKRRPQDHVAMTDTSEKALKVAEKNAESLELEAKFLISDIFDQVPKNKLFQVIYSNPPYIGHGEISEMGQSVLEFEPQEALFAENDGYAFYEKLARQVKEYMDPKGTHLFLEIGYRQAKRVLEIFKFSISNLKSEIWQDFNGLDRAVHFYIEAE